MTHKLMMAQDPTKQLNDSKLLSSPLMGKKENWRKIPLLWTLVSIFKLETCDHVEEITKGVGGNVLQANVEIEWISPKSKKSLQLKTFHFLHLNPNLCNS